MVFSLIIGMEKRNIDNPSVRDINVAIDALNPDIENPFIVLEKSSDKGEIEYIQVFHYKEYSKKLLKYRAEFRTGTVDNFRHHKKILDKKKEIKKYFEDFLLIKKLPESDDWEDITSEFINQNNTSAFFDIFDLAERNYRDNKEIIDCHELYHGFELKETIIYQNIAEAIVLCKTILESRGSCGEIYFTEDKNQFYIDFTFPKKWQDFIPIVYRIRALLSGKNIHISCYDNENNFLQTSIEPLPKFERLLSCFLLILAEKLLTEDDYLFSVMSYYYSPDKEVFEKIYTDFIEKRKLSKYFICYEDAEDFDFSEYKPLSEIYNTFSENFLRNNTSVKEHPQR